MNLTYSELSKLASFNERFAYLKQIRHYDVGEDTFGFDRYLNQVFYRRSNRWKKARREVIIRDNGCDLGIEEFPIDGKIYVHHINPLTKEDILSDSPALYDLNNLIAMSFETHNAIHYGNSSCLHEELIVRYANDTIPWR